ncbi:hypothetical protein FNV43_RR21784 [Rhamnella rubrinervis]|uniref:plant cystathionine gamma-synthase n=1 Tax=Rhamnella rubrinervis TaxID=2594499 RepID=A0A8K0DUW9_9ROSA|nr:hypothetical protein FNV43_RR21784 [Rhamnella rubrinervis]
MASMSSRLFTSFDCRSGTGLSGLPRHHKPDSGRDDSVHVGSVRSPHGHSSQILTFPSNFVHKLSTKARRSCSNIVVAQIVAPSWSDNTLSKDLVVPAVTSLNDVVADVFPVSLVDLLADNELANGVDTTAVPDAPVHFATCNDLAACQDGTRGILAGQRFGCPIVRDALTTPVVNTSAYFFPNTAALKDFKEKRRISFEYARYGNPTTLVAEEKISALEGAESTLLTASGMYTTIVMLLALVPAGGHIVSTTDCCRETRIFMESVLPKLGITVTFIGPADVKALESALDNNKVSLFFSESPTNPFLRCIDIELVSKICHRKGALVCIDGTMASPINQKALALGADLALHSATKYIGGHSDVLGGCISGPLKLISEIRSLHHVFGGTINPEAANRIIQGIKTLHLRLWQQNSTALRMAEILEVHPKVERVHYPGLPSHPERELAKRQMTGFGGVVSFEIYEEDLKTTEFLDLNTTKFVDALKLPYIAPSFGGCDSIVVQPTLMSYWDLSQEERLKYGIKDNLVRFSFGCESFEDLKADLLQALDAI